jgi:hypothetical protein
MNSSSFCRGREKSVRMKKETKKSRLRYLTSHTASTCFLTHVLSLRRLYLPVAYLRSLCVLRSDSQDEPARSKPEFLGDGYLCRPFQNGSK